MPPPKRPELPPEPWKPVKSKTCDRWGIVDANGHDIPGSEAVTRVCCAYTAALRVCEMWSQGKPIDEIKCAARAALAIAYPDPVEPPKSLERRLAECVREMNRGSFSFRDTEKLTAEARASGLLEDT